MGSRDQNWSDMGYLKLFCVILITVIQTAFSFPKGEAEIGKTIKGCVNSCCAVCIPGKNCEVCYQLNRSDPGNCPCLSDLTDSQKLSIERFQKYFIGKLSQQKDEKVWRPSIITTSGDKVYY